LSFESGPFSGRTDLPRLGKETLMIRRVLQGADSHYGLLTVHGKRLEFKAFDYKGRLFDSFDLTK
jgi:hypothetical protein